MLMASEHIGVGANEFQIAMSGELLAVAMASEQIAAGADELIQVANMSGELLAAAMARSEQLVPGAVDEFLAAMSGELLVAAGDMVGECKFSKPRGPNVGHTAVAIVASEM